MDYEKKDYYETEEEYEEYDDEYETELYTFKRKKPYQHEICEVKRQAMFHSELRKEEQTWVIQDKEMQDVTQVSEPPQLKKVKEKCYLLSLSNWMNLMLPII